MWNKVLELSHNNNYKFSISYLIRSELRRPVGSDAEREGAGGCHALCPRGRTGSRQNGGPAAAPAAAQLVAAQE